MTYSAFELKYCERCGGLGMRRDHSGLPYCRSCAQMMQRFLIAPMVIQEQPEACVHTRLKYLLLKPLAGASTREARYVL
jgi:hypothetical protein